MPNRKQKDCTKGKIYFIRSNNPDITCKYVGSTIETLSRRMSTHRSTYKRWLEGKAKPTTIYHEFKKYGIEQFHIELIEDYPCERDEQLLARENFFIRQEDCVNKQLAILTPDERINYYENHKEKIKSASKKNYENNKERATATRKKYVEKNKDKINQYFHDRYKKNKSKLQEKITCECGCQITKQSLTKHLKTKKHLNLIAEKI